MASSSTRLCSHGRQNSLLPPCSHSLLPSSCSPCRAERSACPWKGTSQPLGQRTLKPTTLSRLWGEFGAALAPSPWPARQVQHPDGGQHPRRPAPRGARGSGIKVADVGGHGGMEPVVDGVGMEPGVDAGVGCGWSPGDPHPRATPAQRGPARAHLVPRCCCAQSSSSGASSQASASMASALGAEPGRRRVRPVSGAREVVWPRRRRHRRGGTWGRAARARGRTERGARSPEPPPAAAPPSALPPAARSSLLAAPPPGPWRPSLPIPSLAASLPQGQPWRARPSWPLPPVPAGRLDRQARHNLVPEGRACPTLSVEVTGPAELVGSAGAEGGRQHPFTRLGGRPASS